MQWFKNKLCSNLAILFLKNQYLYKKVSYYDVFLIFFLGVEKNDNGFHIGKSNVLFFKSISPLIEQQLSATP